MTALDAPGSRSWTTAAAASIAAAMIHAAAAGAHADDRTLAVLFAVAAVLQVAWAGYALMRPSAFTGVAGVALQLGIAGVWAASRTVGIGFVDGLGSGQEISLQDSTAVALELVATLGATLAVWPGLRRVVAAPLPRREPRFAAMVGVAALAVAVPAMSFPHEHDHDSGGLEVAAHAHGEPVDGVAIGGGVVEGDSAVGVLAGMPGVTDEQRARALELIDATREALAAFPDVASVEAAGYRSIGDGFTGFEHFVHRGFLADPSILDPATVESLVFEVDEDGSRELVSGMYILPPGTTMDDVPDVGGPLTVWHDHQNLCWHPDGRLAGILVNGECTAGVFRATPPMLHVWITDHPCGPFAGIDGTHGSGCEHDH